MVSNYKKKSNRGSWKEENMAQALQAVAEKRMGWLMASKHFQVPQATLRRRAMNKNKIALGTKKHLGRHETTLNEDLEKALVQHILALEARFFGLTSKDVRILAYELAIKMKLKHQFNNEKKIAGKGWLRSFRLRNPKISLRQPEATSIARAEAFNKPQVEKFFSNLEKTINNGNFDKTMIFNMDESALTTVQNPSRIFALKGKKQVGAITSGERGVHSTVVVCMSSGGTYIPPAIIFPRKKFNPTLYDGAPVGTLCLYNESGYMTGELFVKWMEHFIKHVRPTAENKALLLLDGHVSHKNLGALELAKKNFVVLFCLPSHCTHRLQPLDVALFGPLSKYYNTAVTQWMKQNPGRPVTLYQVASLFCEAYGKAATPAIALSGFRATGISPLNPDIFPEDMYLPSTVTDVPIAGEETENERANPPEVLNVLGCSGKEEDPSATSAPAKQQEPSSSFGTDISMEILPDEEVTQPCITLEKETSIADEGNSSNNIKDILMEISPLPQGNARSTNRKKNTYQDVLTESPFLQSLREREENKMVANARKSERKSAKRNVFSEKSAIEESSQIFSEKKTENSEIIRKSARVSSKKTFFGESSDSENEEPFDVEDDEDDCACLYCNGLYSRSKPREGWLRCIQCRLWAHADCAGLKMSTKKFVCDLCH